MKDDDFPEDDFLEDDGDADGVADADLPAVAMLIVDDEPGIHDVTRLALTGFQFQGHRLTLISAFSAAEARAILTKRDDIAAILLDVVMESETAGLDLVRTIRQDIGNVDVRIILRTGQPGQAPEESVIVAYDINDYKAKSELTRTHLLTCVTGALRSWRDIQDLHHYRRQAYALAGRQAALIDAVLGLIDEPAAVLDPDGLIMAANEALAGRIGKHAQEVVGLDLAAVGLPELADSVLAPDPQSLAPADARLKAVRNEEGLEAWVLRLVPGPGDSRC